MKLKIKLRENKIKLKEEEEIEDTAAQDEVTTAAAETKKREAVLKQNKTSIDNLLNYLEKDGASIKKLLAADIEAKENDFDIDQLFKAMVGQLRMSSTRLTKLKKS